MMTISITAEAYAAIRSTLPKGVRAKPRLSEGGGFKITLDRHTLDRLKALRGPGESYSDVILRLAGDARTRESHTGARGCSALRQWISACSTVPLAADQTTHSTCSFSTFSFFAFTTQ